MRYEQLKSKTIVAVICFILSLFVTALVLILGFNSAYFDAQTGILNSFNIVKITIISTIILYIVSGAMHIWVESFIKSIAFLVVVGPSFIVLVTLVLPATFTLCRLVELYQISQEFKNGYYNQYSYSRADEDNDSGYQSNFENGYSYGYQKAREEARRAAEEEKNAGKKSFFEGCDSEEALTKRYKALVKAYHPDSGFGDNESFLEIQKEYDELKKKYA